MKRKLLLTILFWTALVTVFLFLSASLSLVAAGYQFDWASKSLQKTGLLYLSGEPRNVTIAINGEVVASRFPLRLPTIFPGEYRIVIEKEGYVPWRNSFRISPGEALSRTDIKLFLAEPEVSVVTDPEIIREVKENTAPSTLIVGQELRYQNELVTRVSGTLADAELANDRAHVFFQVGQEVRAVDIDGGNERLLYTLDADVSSQILSIEDDSELLLLDGASVKRLRVR